ncbi:MAG: alpha/beta fold hydrolase [Chlamydiae bacterium]|nr:alpha/beta fold hydrolase [Chlamydiota bacterium]MBI3277087.1 alpha/beta fold hydrolase [Chlamydiota bacterium]
MILAKNIILTLSGLGILIFVYALLYFYRSLKPPRFITPIQPSNYGLKWENIALKTSDGLTLKGWFIPPPFVLPNAGPPSADWPAGPTKGGGIIPQPHSNAAIIVCHGYPFDKGNVLPIAKFLHSEYNLLLFDFRAMGESEGRMTTLGYHETKDVQAALDFLERKGIQKIGILGFSLGASVALLSVSDERIKAVVADCPFASLDILLDEMFQNLFFLKQPFKAILKKLARSVLKINFSQISPLKSVSNTSTPILLIHGDEDSQIPHSHSLLLKKANPKIQFWQVPEADHIQTYELYPEEYEKRVIKFLKEAFEITQKGTIIIKGDIVKFPSEKWSADD